MNPNDLFQQFFGGNQNFGYGQGGSNQQQNFNPFNFSQQQNSNPYANININNSYNMGNNYYQQPNYHPGQNSNQSQNQSRSSHQSSKVEEKIKKKAEEKMEKDPILEAESNPNSGHYYKKQGNDYFTKGQYQEAIKYYSKAIEMNNGESIFYSNRARCWKKLEQFKNAYEDAKLAVELDDKNIKAHLLCGQLLAELGKHEATVDKVNLSINRMTKALTLCAGQKKKDFEKDLQKNILRAKKLRWYKQQEMARQVKIDKLKEIKNLISQEDHLSKEERDRKYESIVELMGDPYASLTFEVPDFLQCKITMEMMEDPVITEAGVTYEKEALNIHLKKNGNFDPVSREPLNPDCIFPNLGIKQAIDAFISQHPWAFEHIQGETIEDIKF